MSSEETPLSVDTESARLLIALEEKELEIERARAELSEFKRRAGLDGGARVRLADLSSRQREQGEDIVSLRHELTDLRQAASSTAEALRRANARLDALGTATRDSIDAIQQERLSSTPGPDALQVRRNRQFVVVAVLIICLVIVWLMELL